MVARDARRVPALPSECGGLFVNAALALLSGEPSALINAHEQPAETQQCAFVDRDRLSLAMAGGQCGTVFVDTCGMQERTDRGQPSSQTQPLGPLATFEGFLRCAPAAGSRGVARPDLRFPRRDNFLSLISTDAPTPLGHCRSRISGHATSN
jgi:hypothetical protein